MTAQFFGERIKRNEDPRLLTGQALFVNVEVAASGIFIVLQFKRETVHQRAIRTGFLSSLASSADE